MTITREEAKLLLIRPVVSSNVMSEIKAREIEAYNMAIEALSEQSGDLISRADAIAAMGEEPEIWIDTDEEWAYHDAWVEHISALKALPSVEAKLAQAEKCEDCIHNGTNKDKITCKDCVSPKAEGKSYMIKNDNNK